MCTFLIFHIHLKVNSARLVQNVLNKSSRVLYLVFLNKFIFFKIIAKIFVWYHFK